MATDGYSYIHYWTNPLNSFDSQEKLKLTAALHLDRIRLACEADEKIKLLLTTSVADLRSKIVGSVEIICEELDELKSILVEESIERC